MPEKKIDETVNPKATESASDRVAMLSLKSDGTPDQTNPIIIGDKEAALDAAKRQFAEQAVSAVDEAERVKNGLSVAAEKVEQDPAIDALTKVHEQTSTGAEKRAESVVSVLHQD